MNIALLPLDERPVNTRLPVDVGAVAGARVHLPGRDLLPRMRVPGQADLLGEWLLGHADADAAVVSVDMLAHGGLIAARTTQDATATVLRRLDVLRRLREAAPALPISAVSLVTRASDGYSGDEEPSYWPSYGRELHAYGGLLHRAHQGEPVAERLAELDAQIPAPVRSDFQRRRLRNHVVNLESLRLHAEGVVDPLLITADDTAVHSAGSVEQDWLRHWARALDAPGTLLMYPGADEVGALLVARALAAAQGEPIRVAVVAGDPAGLDLVAPFENLPAGLGARRQAQAAGTTLVEDPEAADVVLVVHTPDPGRGDWCGAPPQPDPAAAKATVQAVRAALDTGAAVALADVRHTNGSDPALVEALIEQELIEPLAAYGGWNTAGNTMGSVVAAAVATIAGRRNGTLDARAATRLKLHRLVEDYAYQAVVRPRLAREHRLGYTAGQFREGAFGGERAQGYLDQVETLLRPLLRALAGDDRWTLGDLTLPWTRTFEIDFTLTPCPPN
ncbi:DUF4127 family protein [Nonomuraea pusilla]|uniref:DUF4127 family protein n=1 Tax=Nonomuraea pusilla TaxID=46177 RepID=A0A1H7NHU0_9ACTN|nr:DUF4127 family protein [Nonomuraea pusilla]SEL23066.1 Protein of unknown function [Nonomuraea pusilla]